MTMTKEAPPAGRPDGPAPVRDPRPASAPLLGQDVRRTLLALLASMLGAVPLCELFVDRGWLIDVWLTMIIAVAPAAWMRRNRPPSAGQVWVGVILLVPWLTVNFVREHAVLGFIPLRGAWKDIGNLLTDLHTTTTDSVAPVHTTVAVRLAVCALLGLIAALVDLLAVVGRRGALAGVPLLIVFTVSGAVPRHPVSWVWFALSAVGFLILLALDSSDDLHRWGHYVARSRTTGRRRLGNYSGQRIAAVAILLAVALPLAIPSDSRNLIANWFHNSPTKSDDFGAGDNFGAGSGASGIDPFARLRGQLIRPEKLNLLDVTVSGSDIGGAKDPKPFYLRSNVLSDFTGAGWRAVSHGSLQSLDDTDYGSSPGTAFAPNTVKYQADIDVTGLRSNPPIFGSPESITGVDGSTRWSSQDMLMLGNKIKGGQRIVEQVAQPAPTVAELRAATRTDPSMQRYTELKVPISDFVRRTTSAAIGSAKTPYEKARAITQYFANPANNFQYSLSTGTSDTSDALADFLRNKLGYCQQYAAAMAVMLRLSGVPSRVVLGYAHPEPDADGKFTVTSYDAHAWVEAYFSGIGWIPFDPTPVEGISGGKAADLPWASHDVPSNAPSASVPAGSSVSLPARSNRPDQNQPSAPPVAASSTDGGGSGAPFLVFGLVVLALLLVALVPAAVRWRRRRHRLHLARGGDMSALWRELQDSATDLGYAWSPARTPRQVASWLGGTKDDPTGALRAIAEAVERDRYAPAGSSAANGDRDLVADLRTVIASLQSRRSSRERARAIFWPESLGWTSIPLPGRFLPSAAGLRRH